MKKIIVITLFLGISFLIIGTTNSESKHNPTPINSASQQKQLIYITPSETGYDIYSAENELLLEFTKTNIDSASLETLNYIYEVSKEYNK